MGRRCICVLFLLPLALPAQRGGPPAGAGRQRTPGAQQEAVRKPEEYGVIEGSVVNAMTGEPLRKATVTVRRTETSQATAGLPRVYTTTTDSAGRYAVSDIAPGRYRISASRNGFVETDYGERDPQLAGTVLTLGPRQRISDIVIRLIPHGVISGRVVDEDGEPMASVHVQAMRYRYSQGRKQLSTYGTANSNDLGEYRIFGLPPGRYYISATVTRFPLGDRFGPGPPPGTEQASAQQYVTIYYPGTPDLSTAAPVEVGAGGEIRGLDLAMTKYRTVTVKGRVTDATGSNRQRLMVYLTPKEGGSFAAMRRAPAVDANGDFEIRGVTPGSYFLVATIADRERPVAAKAPLQVGSSGVENASIQINPPMELAGRIRVDGGGPTNLSGVQVTLQRRDTVGGMFGPNPSARVQADGSFRIANVTPDLYTFVFSGLPEGCYVKSIRSNDADVLAGGLDLMSGTLGAIDVVLSPNAGTVSGVVQNDQQQPAPGVTVVLVPEEKERREQAQYYRTAVTDANGRFTMRGVSPGKYSAYSWEYVEYGAYFDPEFMRAFANRGETVTIREGGQEELKLRLIP